MDFYAGAALIGTATAVPHSVVWSNAPAGSYALTATATDNLGGTVTSAPVNVTVAPGPNQAPAVNITSPSAGATFTAPANISISANATDPDGSVERVDFYAGQTLIGTATGAPFIVSWNNVAVGSYTLTATATDNLNAVTTSSAVNITVTTPPAPPAPSGVNAVAGNAQVALSWNASVGATSYNLRRAIASGGPYTTIASGLSTTGYTDSSVANGTTYFYVVSALGDGGESGNSSEVSATPQIPLTTPAAPTGLRVTAVSRTQINLAWGDNSPNEAGFRIEQSTNGTSFTEIGTVSANATTFANVGLKQNRLYYYRVRAYNTVGNSAYSNTVSAKTPAK